MGGGGDKKEKKRCNEINPNGFDDYELRITSLGAPSLTPAV